MSKCSHAQLQHLACCMNSTAHVAIAATPQSQVDHTHTCQLLAYAIELCR
jgi:hypothetical protein